MPATTADEVLAFWFAAGREKDWFERSETFDRAVGEVLLPAHERAAAGALDDWQATPRGGLALVVLLDQVPRNLFRDTPRSFATDAAARQVARRALWRGHDLALGRSERLFLYLPLEHSEALTDQWFSVALFSTLDDEKWTLYARRHAEIIERFGRFPHRNTVLGRTGSLAEDTFLGEPMSRF